MSWRVSQLSSLKCVARRPQCCVVACLRYKSLRWVLCVLLSPVSTTEVSGGFFVFCCHLSPLQKSRVGSLCFVVTCLHYKSLRWVLCVLLSLVSTTKVSGRFFVFCCHLSPLQKSQVGSLCFVVTCLHYKSLR